MSEKNKEPNHIVFRGVRYMTAAAFPVDKPHELLGVEIELCSTPLIKGQVVGVDLMRSTALIRYSTPFDPDELEPVYSVMLFDGLRTLLIAAPPDKALLEQVEAADLPETVRDYVETIKTREAYHVPSHLTCSKCGWSGGAIEADVEPFYYRGAALSMREGDNYNCPSCGSLILHHVTRMS